MPNAGGECNSQTLPGIHGAFGRFSAIGAETSPNQPGNGKTAPPRPDLPACGHFARLQIDAANAI